MKSLKDIINESLNNDMASKFISSYRKEIEAFHKETIKDKYAVLNKDFDYKGKNYNVNIYASNVQDMSKSWYEINDRNTNKTLVVCRPRQGITVKNIEDAIIKYFENI